MADKKPKQEKVRKGDPNKQFDVVVSVIHDDRKGTSRSVQKPQRFSFATEAEAVEFANNIKEEK